MPIILWVATQANVYKLDAMNLKPCPTTDSSVINFTTSESPGFAEIMSDGITVPLSSAIRVCSLLTVSTYTFKKSQQLSRSNAVNWRRTRWPTEMGEMVQTEEI